MALRESPSPEQRKKSWALVRALLSAVQEWLLIVLLFTSAIYSFLITKFAHYCKLQIPCLLCSRLDHILGKEKPGYLWKMVCATHRLEISSLVSCHAHNQLVDVRDMCENCLFSFATINKSNAETYRLLVGKLGEDQKDDSNEDASVKSPLLHNQKTKYCSCCNKPWTSKRHVQNFIHARSLEKEDMEFDLPLPGPIVQNQDLKNIQEQALVPLENTYKILSPCDSQSRMGYKEVKITSDTESEVSMSKDDDGDARALACGYTSPGIDFSVQSEQLGPCIITLSDDLVTEKLLETDPAPFLSNVGYKKVKITSDSESEVSMSNDDNVNATALISETPFPRIELSVQSQQPEPHITMAESSVTEKLLGPDLSPDHSFAMSQRIVNPNKDTTTFSATAIRQQSEEFKQKQDGENSDPFPLEEVIHTFTSVVDHLTPSEVTEENKFIAQDNVPLSSMTDVLESKRHRSPDEVLSKDATENAAEVPKDQSDTKEPDKADQTCVDVSEALDRSGNNGMCSETSVVVCEHCLRGSSSLDLGDAYKLAIGNSAKQLSDVLAEEWLVGKDSSRVSEDLKLLLSQLSAARGIDQQTNDMSLKISMTSEEPKPSAPSTMLILQKRISLERNESNLSVDGSIVSEIEGENECERLKRQVEHDMRTIKSLYKELEEERNAAAVAANQAMAMITRLQEEKATIHMEALQNVRMMEEQAEYDIEAMQEANDLLAEREKEMQDLEAELEFYRQRYPDESTLKNVIDIGVDYSEPSRDESSIELQSGTKGDPGLNWP